MNPSNIPFDFSFVFAWRKCHTVPRTALGTTELCEFRQHDGMDILSEE